MLHAQGVMDLLLELDVRVDFVRHGNGSVTPLVNAWFTKFDGLPTATSVVLNEIFGETTIARALRCGEAAIWWPANS